MEYESLTDFFLNASEEEKLEVFKQAAEQANKDQRELIDLSTPPD